jgi:fructose transport system substrate-binding protein
MALSYAFQPAHLLATATLIAGCSSASTLVEPSTEHVNPKPIVGLITKTGTNPFFIQMHEGAKAAARAQGVELRLATGPTGSDGAVLGQAVERMMDHGAKTILITPVNNRVVISALQKAREAGIQVIALDSPTDPADASDALVATNHYRAGFLAGQYAKAALAGKPPVIATLDLFPGHSLGVQRHNGFMAGFGLPAAAAGSNIQSSAPEIVCMADTFGSQAKSKLALAQCLVQHPDINLVYTMNEPVARGAHEALRAAGKENAALIVSIDGSCAGVRDVAAGAIAATVQQYPRRMAEQGVALGLKYAQTGQRATGTIENDLSLITATPQAGLASLDAEAGAALCW